MISNKLELGWKLVYFCFGSSKDSCEACKYKSFTVKRNKRKVYLGFELECVFSGSFSLVLVV